MSKVSSTLINATYLYYNLTQGGRHQLPPQKNQLFKFILPILFLQGLRYIYKRLEPRKWGPYLLNLFPENILKIRECRKYQFRYLEKGAVELWQATKTKPKQIERSSFYASATKHIGIGLSVGGLVGWLVGLFDTNFKKVTKMIYAAVDCLLIQLGV